MSRGDDAGDGGGDSDDDDIWQCIIIMNSQGTIHHYGVCSVCLASLVRALSRVVAPFGVVGARACVFSGGNAPKSREKSKMRVTESSFGCRDSSSL